MMSYIGINNVARKLTSVYVGVNGVARKVTKGYIGVNGVAQQWWGSASSSPEVTEYPVLAAQYTWQDGATEVTAAYAKHVRIVDSYVPVGDEVDSWAADEGFTGSIMCYYRYQENNEGELIIAGNGSGKILANPDSARAFGGKSFHYFSYCKSIDGLELLDTRNVTTMENMFDGFGMTAEGLHLDLSGFDTSKVTNMKMMFYNSYIKTMDLTNFNTSNVTDMSEMFSGCEQLDTIDVTHFNTSKVTDMSGMFSACRRFQTLDISNFDTSSLINATYIFSNCNSLTSIQLPTKFTASKVMGMFNACYLLPAIDTSRIVITNTKTELDYMFKNCYSLITVDMSFVQGLTPNHTSQVFYGCSSLSAIDLSQLDTSQSTSMHSMFKGCSSLGALDLRNFNTSKVTAMNSMFADCSSLNVIYVGSAWTTDNATTTDMFLNCGVSSVKVV